jgi:hypothetical protein
MASKARLFSVSNHHGAGSGEPPQIDGDTKGRYHGYFENEYGEQVVFVYDRQTKKGDLWMGDAGWDRSMAVVDGEARDLVLNEAETLWLKACWLAATGGAQGES